MEAIVEDIYAAAIDAEAFRRMFASICRLVSAHQGCVMIVGGDSTVSYNFNVNPETVRLYNVDYAGGDPWYRQAVALNRQGIVVTGQELVPTRDFEASDYYRDVMLPSDIYDCMSITLEDDGADRAAVILYRPKSEPFFDNKEKRQLHNLVPHLRRMVRLRRVFEQELRRRESPASALDRLPLGVIALDSGRLVRYMNRAAARIVAEQDGISVRQGRLATSDVAASGRLERGVALAATPGRGRCATGSEFAIRRPSGKSPFGVQTVPIAMDPCDEAVLARPARESGAIVLIFDPEQRSRLSLPMLTQVFGVTPTEAALAENIARGMNVRDAAAAHRISESTARWHLKNLHEKTATHSLGELTQLLLSYTCMLDDTPG